MNILTDILGVLMEIRNKQEEIINGQNRIIELLSGSATDETETKIKYIMKDVGMNQGNLGEKYICSAIVFMLENPECISRMTNIYQGVAAVHQEPRWKNVCQRISCSIETAWKNGNSKKISKIFKLDPNRIPKNFEFLRGFYKYLKNE